MVDGPEQLRQHRDAARAFLQHMWDNRVKYNSQMLDGKPALFFTLPSGPIGTPTYIGYHSVMDQLEAAGGKEGVDYKMTIGTATKLGETRHDIFVTEKYLERVKGFKRPIEIAEDRDQSAQSARSIG